MDTGAISPQRRGTLHHLELPAEAAIQIAGANCIDTSHLAQHSYLDHCARRSRHVNVHYYLTSDGNTSPVLVCDYAFLRQEPDDYSAVGAVQGTFVPMGADATQWADTYLELSFPSAMLHVGSTLEVNVHTKARTTYSITSRTTGRTFRIPAR